MWEYEPPRKPLYLRTWFLVVLCMVVTIGAAGCVLLLVEKAKWEKRAGEFDYSKLEEMESASVIYDRNGQVLGRIFIQNRDQVAGDQ
jgi:hypothetical protein